MSAYRGAGQRLGYSSAPTRKFRFGVGPFTAADEKQPASVEPFYLAALGP
jgi:hypothetical protein